MELRAALVGDKHKGDDYWPEAILLTYCIQACRRSGGGAMVLVRLARQQVVHVKQGDGFSPKRHQERTIPLLMEAFEAQRRWRSWPVEFLGGKPTRGDGLACVRRLCDIG